jgi:hypothetical protein
VAVYDEIINLHLVGSIRQQGAHTGGTLLLFLEYGVLPFFLSNDLNLDILCGVTVSFGIHVEDMDLIILQLRMEDMKDFQ